MSNAQSEPSRSPSADRAAQPSASAAPPSSQQQRQVEGSGSTEGAQILVSFEKEAVAAVDAWIARREEPRPNREEAIRIIVAHHLGGDGPSTMLPTLVTGRDIV